jgi:putative oxidoreductase
MIAHSINSGYVCDLNYFFNEREIYMDVVLLIARVIFAIMFINSGIAHFKNTAAMTGYAQFKKVPAAKVAVQLSGLLMLLGGLSIATGVWIDLGAIVIAVMLVAMAIKMHDFWTVTDPAAKQPEMINFWKNISLAGGALFIFATYAQDSANTAFQIVGPFFGVK